MLDSTKVSRSRTPQDCVVARLARTTAPIWQVIDTASKALRANGIDLLQAHPIPLRGADAGTVFYMVGQATGGMSCQRGLMATPCDSVLRDVRLGLARSRNQVLIAISAHSGRIRRDVINSLATLLGARPRVLRGSVRDEIILALGSMPSTLVSAQLDSVPLADALQPFVGQPIRAFVISPSLRSLRVTARFDQTPWPIALWDLLSSYGLSAVREGNIIRIE